MITVRADRSLVRADARSRRYLAVALRAPEAPPRKGRLPVSLAFVIDRSGSMHGQKIEHARSAVVQGIRSLREGDRFAVVAYDDRVELVVPGTPATAEAREAAVAAVRRVDSRGSTDLHAGWSKGCEEVATALTKDAVGRCLLLTDGLANAGLTDHDEIVRQAAGWRDRRVVTTTFGVGANFDETLLRRMSDAGGGNFQFIESAPQIADFVASEVGEALAITVREGVLVMDAGAGAVVESLNDFPCRQEGEAWRVAFGSLASGQELRAVLRVTLPEGRSGETRDVTVRVEDQDGALGQASATARFTWASHAENDRQPRDRDVDRQVAALYAARAERDALERNRKRDYDGAQMAIQACLKRIGEYAGDDPELQALVADLKRKAAWYGRAIDSISSKSLYSLSNQTLKGRLLKKLHGQPGSSQGSLVPTEWEAQEAVGQVLKRIAVMHPGLVKGLDVRQLAEQLAHVDARGCLLDPTRDSAGSLELRLETQDLCPPCRARLEAEGLPRERVQELVEALCLLGAPSGVVH